MGKRPQKTFMEVLSALKPESIGVIPVPVAMMEISRSNKKRPAFIKMAIPEEVAVDFMAFKPEKMGLLLIVDRDAWNQEVNA